MLIRSEQVQFTVVPPVGAISLIWQMKNNHLIYGKLILPIKENVFIFI